MRTKCNQCNGTGREQCLVHGSHICSKCKGQGCMEHNNFTRWEPLQLTHPNKITFSIPRLGLRQVA